MDRNVHAANEARGLLSLFFTGGHIYMYLDCQKLLTRAWNYNAPLKLSKT